MAKDGLLLGFQLAEDVLKVFRSLEALFMSSQITLPIDFVQFPNACGMTRHFAVDLHRPNDPVELRREVLTAAGASPLEAGTAQFILEGADERRTRQRRRP